MCPVSLNVTGQTTLQQLREFTEAAGPNAKISARKSDDGDHVVLYARTKSSNLFDRLSGKTQKNRDLTNATLKKLFRDVGNEKIFDRTDVQSVKKNEAIKTFRSILEHFASGKSKSVTAQKLSALSLSAQGATFDKAQARSVEKPDNKLPGGPGMTALNPQRQATIDDQLLLVGTRTNTGATKELQDEAIAGLGRALAQAFNETNPSAGDRLALMVSDGRTMKSELLDNLLGQLGNTDNVSPSDRKSLSEALDRAFNIAASEISPNKLGEMDDDKRTIQLGGVIYTEVKKIGEGAYGDAFIFEAEGHEPIVAKFTKGDDREAAFLDFSTELRAHSLALGEDGHPNVLGLKGAIRTPEGGLVILSELATHGNTFEIGNKLDALVEQNVISSDTARTLKLQMAKDIFAGLQHMQGQGEHGLIHRDLKTPNIFLGEGGVVKLADFGTVLDETTYNVLAESSIDNPRWLAPEVCYSKDAHTRRFSDKEHHEPVVEINKRSMLKDQQLKLAESLFPRAIEIKENGEKVVNPGLLERNERTHFRNIMSGIELNVIDTFKDFGSQDYMMVDGKQADIFSAGMSVYNFFVEKTYMNDESFNSSVESKLSRFSQSDAPAIGDHPDSLNTSTGDGQLDSLLNQVLHRDPQARGSIDSVLDHPIFDNPAIGSKQGRSLLDMLAGLKQGEDGFDIAPNDLVTIRQFEQDMQTL